MTRFSNFTNAELDTLEDGCCQVGAGWMIDEIRLERRLREVHNKTAKEKYGDEYEYEY